MWLNLPTARGKLSHITVCSGIWDTFLITATSKSTSLSHQHFFGRRCIRRQLMLSCTFLLQTSTITLGAPHWSFVMTRSSTSMAAEQSHYQTISLSHTWTRFEGHHDSRWNIARNLVNRNWNQSSKESWCFSKCLDSKNTNYG